MKRLNQKNNKGNEVFNKFELEQRIKQLEFDELNNFKNYTVHKSDGFTYCVQRLPEFDDYIPQIKSDKTL